jgi:putative PIN family toxin of toxin-antitoxin system
LTKSDPNGSPVKLVIDTNVLVSGLFWSGSPARLMTMVNEGRAQHVWSSALLQEFIVVVDRPKFTEPLRKMNCTVSDLVAEISSQATMIVASQVDPPPELRDPKDLIVLAAVVGSGADAIVTGDKDLLALGEFRGIPILDVAEALTRMS